MRLVFLTILGVLLLAVACGDSGRPEPEGVRLRLSEPVLEGGQLTISGETDLPDAAELTYQVTVASEEEPIAEGVTSVAGETYTATVDVSDYPAGDIFVFVQFEPGEGDQPSAVRELFGANGELLDGFNVTVEDGRRYIRLSGAVESD